MDMSIIELDKINKVFHVGTQDVTILTGIKLEILVGDFLIIFGPSGCGKSTLLHVMLGLEAPTSGTAHFLNYNFYSYPEDDRSDFRKRHIGMVYQQPNWIKSLTVVENVAFPLSLLGIDALTRKKKGHEMLKLVDMDSWCDYNPDELSSGQQQKVSMARALITDPEVIIADEPTGNLDYASGQELMELLKELNATHGKTIVMVTHDLEYLHFAKTVVRMFDGSIIGVYTEGEKAKLLHDIKSKRGMTMQNVIKKPMVNV